MDKRSVMNIIFDSKITAVIRKVNKDKLINLCDALYRGGIRSFEITADVLQFADMIKNVKSHFGNDVIVGAGTVLDPVTARIAILNGADFIVSPATDEETINMCKRYGITIVPGAMTPTEILKAYAMSADIVKLFPAGTLGPGYIKEVKGPLQHVPLMVTGGINIDNITDFIKAGASCVGVGGSLVDKKAIEMNDFGHIEKLSRDFCNKLSNLK